MLSVSETSPVEAGEVARVACRRGGDLPRGFAYAQHNGNQTICHPERSEVPWAGRQRGFAKGSE